MNILKYFKKEINQDIELYGKTSTLNTTTGNYNVTTSLIKTVKGFLYEGPGVEQYISDKMKAIVDAVVIVNPSSLTIQEVKDSDRVTVGDRNFTVVRGKDVGNQGEVVQIFLKEIL